jgi:hypothetical protein
MQAPLYARPSHPRCEPSGAWYGGESPQPFSSGSRRARSSYHLDRARHRCCFGDELAGCSQLLEIQENRFAHQTFGLLDRVAGCNDTRQVRRVRRKNSVLPVRQRLCTVCASYEPCLLPNALKGSSLHVLRGMPCNNDDSPFRRVLENSVASCRTICQPSSWNGR